MNILEEHEKIINIENKLELFKQRLIVVEKCNQENRRLKLKVNLLLDKINKASFLKRLKYVFTKKL